MEKTYSMTVKEFIKSKIAELSSDLNEWIDEMETIAHSPNELTFQAGRIAELRREIRLLNENLERLLTTEEGDCAWG